MLLSVLALMKSDGWKCNEQILEYVDGVKSLRGLALIHFEHKSLSWIGNEWNVTFGAVDCEPPFLL